MDDFQRLYFGKVSELQMSVKQKLTEIKILQKELQG